MLILCNKVWPGVNRDVRNLQKLNRTLVSCRYLYRTQTFVESIRKKIRNRQYFQPSRTVSSNKSIIDTGQFRYFFIRGALSFEIIVRSSGVQNIVVSIQHKQLNMTQTNEKKKYYYDNFEQNTTMSFACLN